MESTSRQPPSRATSAAQAVITPSLSYFRRANFFFAYTGLITKSFHYTVTYTKVLHYNFQESLLKAAFNKEPLNIFQSCIFLAQKIGIHLVIQYLGPSPFSRAL